MFILISLHNKNVAAACSLPLPDRPVFFLDSLYREHNYMFNKTSSLFFPFEFMHLSKLSRVLFVFGQ